MPDGVPACSTCGAAPEPDGVECSACHGKVGQRPSLASRLTAAFSGVLLALFGVYTGYQHLVLPLNTGVAYGRGGGAIPRADEPAFFWFDVLIRGGAASLLLLGLGILIVYFGLKGGLRLESVSARFGWRSRHR